MLWVSRTVGRRHLKLIDIMQRIGLQLKELRPKAFFLKRLCARLDYDEKLKLFYYSAYFYYYLWILL